MSLADVAHGILAGDLLLRLGVEDTGIAAQVSSKLTAAERAAEVSAAKVNASTTSIAETASLTSKKLEAAQLRQSAAQETYNRMLRAGVTDTVRLERAQASLLTTERAVSAEQSRLAASAALSSRSRTQQLVDRTLANVPGGAIAGGLVGRAAGALGGADAVALGASAAGALGVVEIVKAATEAYEHEALAVRDLQRASDATAESSSKLHVIFERFNIATDTGATAVLRFGRNIDATPAKLEQFGVAIAKDHQGRVDLVQTLLNANDAFHRLPDGAQRADLALSLFGRGGKSLLPILQANRDTLREFITEAQSKGLVFTQTDLDNAVKYQQSIKDLQETWKGLEIDIGRAVLPKITSTLGGVDKAVSGAKSFLERTHLELLYKYGVGAPFTVAGKELGLLGGHDAKSAQEGLDNAQAAADRAAQIAKQNADTAAAIQSSRASYAGSIDPFAAAAHVDHSRLNDAIASARDQAGSAQRAIADAERNLAEARRSDMTTADDLASAEDRLATAKDRAAAADRRVASAERERTKALESPALGPGRLLKRLEKHVADQRSEAAAVVTLAHEGLSRAAIADLVNVDKTAPGTIEAAAKGMSRKYIREMNHDFRVLGRAEGVVGELFAKNTTDDKQIVARARADMDLYYESATNEGRRLAAAQLSVAGDIDKFARGIWRDLGLGGPDHTGRTVRRAYEHPVPSITPNPRDYPYPVRGATPSVTNFNGPVTFTDPESGKRAAEHAKRRRRQALSGGSGISLF